MLLTRSPLEYPASEAFPFDLHVLSTPPAFVLSQDQTLHKNFQSEESGVKSPNPTKNKQPAHNNHPKTVIMQNDCPKKLQTPQPTTADQDMFASITCDPHLDEERRSHTKYTHAIMIMPAPQQLTPQKAARIIYSDTR